MASIAEPAPVLIRLYGDARLYDVEAARYLSLDEVAEMLRAGQRILVRDAATGEDLTATLLARIAAAAA